MKLLLIMVGVPILLQLLMYWWIFRRAKKNGSYQHCGRASYMGY